MLLFREALTAARASVVPSALVGLVVAATCFAAITTVGRQAALEAALAEQLAGPGARTVTLTDVNNSGALTSPVLVTLERLSGAESAVGTTTPVDVVNGAVGEGSPRVPLVGLSGSTDHAVEITAGRLPMPGAQEAVIPASVQHGLGWVAPLGYLESPDGEQWAVVGSFVPLEPFGDLASMAVTLPSSAGEVYRQVRVVAGSVADAGATQTASLAIVGAEAGDLSVLSPLAAASSSRTVSDQVSGFGRSLLLLILAVGAFFVSVVVLSDVLIRRRDLGRRRTLGITRTDLVTLMALRTTAPALLGAAVGSGAGLILSHYWGSMTPPGFALAVGFLASVTAAVASLPPAAFAATRDPVAVMRTA